MAGTGTIINVTAIIIGSSIGLILSKKFKLSENKNFLQIMGVFILVMGLQMAASANTGIKFIITLASIIIGMLIGEFLQLEKRLENTAKYLELKVKSKVESPFSRALISTSILYCVGPVAILGSIQDGLKNDYSILLTKAILDGSVSIAFAGTMGIGVLFSAIPVFIYQGLITLFSMQAQALLTSPVLEAISSTGGMMLLFSGFNMLGITRISVMNLLPAIVIGGTVAHYFWK